MNNAGLAWKRHGDYENAESYYCLALQSIRFQYNHFEYKDGVFNTLNNLFLLYLDPVKNVAPLNLLATLAHLITAAGGDPGGNIRRTGVMNECGTPTLKAAYQNATEEQMCRVIQSIIDRSTSVKEMRAAILSCSNRGVVIDIEMGTNIDTTHMARETKDHAREYLRGRVGSAVQLASCSACGEMKEEKKLQICACHNAYYCDANCQKVHWPEHKAECNATRKAASKKKKRDDSEKSESGGGDANLGLGDLAIE